jgi:UDP-N-acetylglucosamine transferase subunit ALG13
MAARARPVAAAASSSSLGSPPTPYVFVTVGTTSFDAFVAVVCSSAFAHAVAARGYRGVVLQVGRGAFAPPHGAAVARHDGAGTRDEAWAFDVPLSPSSASSSSSAAVRAPRGQSPTRNPLPTQPSLPAAAAAALPFVAYRFKASIAGDLAGAALVLSHAGAGSVFESLRAHKPLLVVVNTALADNHQVEIAAALGQGQGGHLAWCEPSGLVAALAALDPAALRRLPPPDATRFTAAVDALMGQEQGHGHGHAGGDAGGARAAGSGGRRTARAGSAASQ